MPGGASQEPEGLVQLIRERIGVQIRAEDAEELLARRPGSLAALSPGRYAEHLCRNPDGPEWARVCERLAVPETHFFRNRPQWDAFRTRIAPRAAARAARESRALRIWSAGCSTGEEPYTAAGVLAELGHTSATAAIVATDLVEARLDAARKGAYRRNSLRGVREDEVARLFDRRGDVYVLRADLREAVRFERLNLAEPGAVAAFVASQGPFDVVFCRNVLIYFHPELIRTLLERFASALAESGTLVLGHADFASQWTDALVPERVGEAFVWSARPDAPAALAPPPLSRSNGGPRPARRARPPRPAPALARVAPELGADWSAVQELLRLVRTGPGERAVEAARAYLDGAEVVPEAHFALGAALEMAGELDAARGAYRRAVFLDRRFSLARWRLAMLLVQDRQLERADLEARAAVRALPHDAPERLRVLSDLERADLEKILEDSLTWIATIRAANSGSPSSSTS